MEWFALAEKLGVPVTEVGAVPLYWRLAAGVMLRAEGLVAEARQARQQQ